MRGILSLCLKNDSLLQQHVPSTRYNKRSLHLRKADHPGLVPGFAEPHVPTARFRRGALRRVQARSPHDFSLVDEPPVPHNTVMAKRGCDGQVLGGRVRKSSQDTLFGLDFKVLTHCVIIGYAMTFRGRSGRKKCILSMPSSQEAPNGLPKTLGFKRVATFDYFRARFDPASSQKRG